MSAQERDARSRSFRSSQHLINSSCWLFLILDLGSFFHNICSEIWFDFYFNFYFSIYFQQYCHSFNKVWDPARGLKTTRKAFCHISSTNFKWGQQRPQRNYWVKNPIYYGVEVASFLRQIDQPVVTGLLFNPRYSIFDSPLIITFYMPLICKDAFASLFDLCLLRLPKIRKIRFAKANRVLF